MLACHVAVPASPAFSLRSHASPYAEAKGTYSPLAQPLWMGVPPAEAPTFVGMTWLCTYALRGNDGSCAKVPLVAELG